MKRGNDLKNQRSEHFCLCAPTNPSANALKDLRGSWTKFHEMFAERTRFIGVKVDHPFCELPNLCRMPAHKMKTGCVNFCRYEPLIGHHNNVP